MEELPRERKLTTSTEIADIHAANQVTNQHGHVWPTHRVLRGSRLYLLRLLFLRDLGRNIKIGAGGWEYQQAQRGVSPSFQFPGLAQGCPLLPHPPATPPSWEGIWFLPEFSACPESLGMAAREDWASGELCFLACEALQSPAVSRRQEGNVPRGLARWRRKHTGSRGLCSGEEGGEGGSSPVSGGKCHPQQSRTERNTPGCACTGK